MAFRAHPEPLRSAPCAHVRALDTARTWLRLPTALATLPQTSSGRRRFDATGEDFSIGDSEYADDTALPFCSRADVEEQTPLVMTHFSDTGAWR